MKQIKKAKEILDPEKGSVKKAMKKGRIKEIIDLKDKK
ncbi:hypothetical protein EV214_102267 [Marinisporobacter balticus]|uniref:Uncharacterized protein n=1 Tax=Marinisporobacter balticus TaxID=2018667 RepID=A0A4R2L1Q1_9FIRM|nr:hypothetical protein EV214_102267 [Marinisporobacter balticus]